MSNALNAWYAGDLATGLRWAGRRHMVLTRWDNMDTGACAHNSSSGDRE